MPKRSSKARPPVDVNQLAKAIVDRATGGHQPAEPAEAPQDAQPEDGDVAARKAAARLLGSRGGRKGGKARAEALTPEERSEIARKAAQARWGGRGQK
jgi:hypothetical protein